MIFVLMSFIGCGNDTLGPYSVGLMVEQKALIEQNTNSYRITDGGEPVSSSGVIGSGTSCLIAETSSGSRTNTFIGEELQLIQVVGETELSQPLVPNSSEFPEEFASVVQFRKPNSWVQYN